ncbi:hypothetical protein [Sphingobacterium sp. T2]|uniref:hypothetical protein n=1 Tax=Sphingobacterium sp. T2 TaxID=1590596 RepID=UPI0012DFFAFA|nr:hypothetical protein [Sphingobacterium sp. T2]
MSTTSSLIKSWVPDKVAVALLALAMFPHLMLLSMFNLNSTFTASFLVDGSGGFAVYVFFGVCAYCLCSLSA